MYPPSSFFLSGVVFASVHTFPSRAGAMGNTSNNDSSLQEQERAITDWLLFRGNRLLIVGIALGLIWVISFILIEFRVLEVGPSSTMPTLLGGIIAGQLTLFTVTLSINQLILSRMFASPPEIKKRLLGTAEYRHQVRAVMDSTTLPADPQGFLTVIADLLQTHSEELKDSIDTVNPRYQDLIEKCVTSLHEYAELVKGLAEDESTEILHIVSGLSHHTYVHNSVVVEELQAELRARPKRISEVLGDISIILESIPVARQYFKTIVIQQQLARLSRYIVYLGLPSIFIAVLLLLAYTSSGGLNIPEPYIHPVAAFSIAVVLGPSVLLSAYILPLAIIAERTVSTGPFLVDE